MSCVLSELTVNLPPPRGLPGNVLDLFLTLDIELTLNATRIDVMSAQSDIHQLCTEFTGLNSAVKAATKSLTSKRTTHDFSVPPRETILHQSSTGVEFFSNSP